jgi:exportin-2 (importin alpha re-exporter)
MLTSPPNIQSQLGEAVSTIADSDFWERWPTLMSDLANRLMPDNPDINSGVLQVGHSIFKRWRPLFRSDPLFLEINHVLEQFGAAFLNIVQHTDNAIQQNANNKQVLTKHINVLNLAVKIFFDLACQDLPPIFEENIAAVSSLLNKYISYDNPILHTDDESESGVLEYLKASIFETLTLYIQKYDDAFGATVQEHVTSCWNFLTNVGSDPKYDVLVSKALRFLTAVAFIPHHAQLFSSENVITEIVQRVIIPNLTLREADLELFEDEPIEYIRRDLEGSDNDTRRRGATDFLRQLVSHHDAVVTKIVSDQINAFLAEFAKNPAENWKHKDTAIYLFCSIAAKGQATAGQGVTTVNPLVDISDFFQKHIAQDLSSNTVHPILQVDAIKFIYVFRGLLDATYWHACFPLLVQHLNSSNYVIYTYAAIVVERALAMTNPDKSPIIPSADILNLAKDLLQHLFSLIQKNTDPAKIQENEFLMRCVMRVLIVIKDGVIPILDTVMRNFINITNVIRHNPSNPRFYYYHFEGIGALIKFGAPSQPEKLETAFYEPFAYILQNDVQEFAPYVFQLFAALLEANPSGALSSYYIGIIPPILLPSLWESKGNVPALVRLLSALIPRGASSMEQNNQIEPILGIFQKLLSAKSSEAYGFDLLEAVISSFPPAKLEPYFVPMLQIMLTRLDKSKTEQFAQRLTRFYHFFAARDKQGLGADVFVSICDQVQQE